MTWAKLDDRAHEHRKLLAVGAEACWLWACGLMYANRQRERDGFIPESAIAMLYPFKRPKRLVERLVTASLWERVENGYRIHDFHDWNQSKTQHEAALASARERAAKSYASRTANLENSIGYANSSREEPLKSGVVFSDSSGSTPTPTPTPTPLPDLDIPTVCQPGVATPRPAPQRQRTDSKPKSRTLSIPVPMSDAVEIPADLILAKATQWQVDKTRIEAQIPEFRRYWTDEGTRRSPRGWCQSFGIRIDQLGKRGFLHQATAGVGANRGKPPGLIAHERETGWSELAQKRYLERQKREQEAGLALMRSSREAEEREKLG